jgi:glutamate/tyrosine decarboxylase-like PLP-dependent enzyme
MLLLDVEVRAAVWAQVAEAVERYVRDVPDLPVAPRLDEAAMRALLEPFDFESPIEPAAAIAFAVDNLRLHQVHCSHPRYFGRFNPAPSTMGIAGDALVAAFNPQLAAWSYSPFAVELEQHLARAFAARFGFDPDVAEGLFTFGSAEGNLTAVLTALYERFPDAAARGVRALPGDPVIYVSAEAHHSLHKAARAAGLGLHAVSAIPVDERLRMRVDVLRQRIAADRAGGRIPLLAVATVGTTSAGSVDPVKEVARVAEEEGLWMHVDAAWGGAAVLVPERRHLLAGAERAHSLTVDVHKWLSVPMGAGLFLTSRPGALHRTFSTETEYMPLEAAGLEVADPYTRSLQWSRRFIGLKLFLTLAVAGWEGYTRTLRHQLSMADLLVRELEAEGWAVVNDPSLAVVCFVDRLSPAGERPEFLASVARRVVDGGHALVAVTRVGGGRPVLRACVTNYRTGEEDVRALVRALGRARQEAAA